MTENKYCHQIDGNKVRFLPFYLFTFLLLFASCKESDNTVEEYPDWKNRNETYFTQLYNQAVAAQSAGSNEYKVFRNWSLPEDNDYFTATAADHIVVQVLKDGGSQTPSPLYNDTVVVSYRGRLLPSTSYAEGRVFEDHLGTATNPQAYTYVKMGVSTTVTYTSSGGVSSSSNIDGFTTLLQHMRIGDYWRAYIPYQLGYGEKDTSTIPAYSTLVFDIYLKAYYHPGETVPPVQGKADVGGWTNE